MTSNELLGADKQFAMLSKPEGVIAAFSEYLTENATLLPNNSPPVLGKGKIIEFLKTPGNYEMSWIPLEAIVSESGELGYSWGNWTMTIGGNKESGKYMDIWVKEEGNWKVVMDMTNMNPNK